MKFGKKLFLVLGLVALLVGTFASTAFAAETRIVRSANVTKIQLLDDQPAAFRLIGSYTCDLVDVTASVNGKVIIITTNDVKIRYTGHGCDKSKTFRKDITIGTLVPGNYVVLVNPDSRGVAQKKLKFVAPVLPDRATPAATAPAQP